MSYHLAEINIAKFRLPMDHPDNVDFVQSLDRVNAIAESQPGFVWRLVGSGNSALDVQTYDDPNIIVNMSVWNDMESLANFAYRNADHREIMRRRREWFDKIDFHLALWWIPVGHIPTITEGKARLELLAERGPTPQAFLFGRPLPAPNASRISPILDECA
jgi:heme-degrading monooxygenase HmoA